MSHNNNIRALTMMEVMVAVQVAGAAFKGIKGALEQGREVTETIGYFAKFFE